MMYLYSILFYTSGLIFGLLICRNISISTISHPDIYSTYTTILYGKSDYELFFKILKSNITVAFVNLIGSLTFGIFTAISLFFNGFVLAYAITVSLKITDTYTVFRHTYPHIIEVGAFIISGSIGLNLGKYLFKKIFLNADNNLPYKWQKSINYFFISLLILLISAIAETKISMK